MSFKSKSPRTLSVIPNYTRTERRKLQRAWRKVIRIGMEYCRHKAQSRIRTDKFTKEITAAVNAARELEESLK